MLAGSNSRARAPLLAASDAPRRASLRQQSVDCNKMNELAQRVHQLRIANMEKDQRIANLNKELVERDRLIQLLRKKQESGRTGPPGTSSSAPRAAHKALAGSRPAAIGKKPAVAAERDEPLPPQFAVKKLIPPFINYCRFQREHLKQNHPELSAVEVTRILGARWRALEDGERAKYE